MKWCFLLGSAEIGGGTHVVFQHAQYAYHAGIEVTIVMDVQVHQSQLDWFPLAKKLNWSTYDKEKNNLYDVAIATWWKTIYKMSLISATSYIYFVQSIESRFYQEEDISLRVLADATYTLPFNYITEATWIQQHLLEKYSHKCALVRNGIDKNVFTHIGEAKEPRDSSRLRVLVEGPADISFKNVPRAVRLCREAGADEVWLLTSTPLNSFAGADKVFSQIPVSEVAEVCRSCDVIVKLSYVEGMFGPPLEMFHCGGTSITYDVTGSDEYIVNEHNGIIVPRDEDALVVKYIKRLKAEREYLVKLQENAIKTAAEWIDWSKSSELFMQAVKDAASKPVQIKQSNMANVLGFFNQYYTIAEDYREKAGLSGGGKAKNLKKWIREKHPRLFNRLKKAKLSLENR